MSVPVSGSSLIIRDKRPHLAEDDEETSMPEKVMRLASVANNRFYECLSSSAEHLQSGNFIPAIVKLNEAIFGERPVELDEKGVNVIRYVSSVYSEAGHIELAAMILRLFNELNPGLNQ